MALLTVKNLHVSFDTPTGVVQAVRGVSFDLGKEKLGIVGESGSGKSQTGRAILGLIPENGRVTADKLDFDGIDILTANKKTMQSIRGNRISMVMQDPKYSLNPVMQVGEQIVEALRVHNRLSHANAKQRAIEMLDAVEIRNPERVYRAYPGALSGGMGQRVMIAMMMIPEPEIMIADEPTSALDVTVQNRVLAVLDELIERRGMGLIFISHDLNLVSSFCDRILVMYGGRVMETITASKLDQAKHPYTQGLLNCLPSFDKLDADLPVLKRDEAWFAPGGNQ